MRNILFLKNDNHDPVISSVETNFIQKKYHFFENNIDYRTEIFGLSPVNKELDDFNQFAQDAQQAQ